MNIFGRINADGNVDILHKVNGEAVTRMDANVYPVGSTVSVRYEHPAGIVLTRKDARDLGINIEGLTPEPVPTGHWVITTTGGQETTVDELTTDYPLLYAADEAGFEIDPDDLNIIPEHVADGGYGGRDTRRILFWPDEDTSENDDGAAAIATAAWEDGTE